MRTKQFTPRELRPTFPAVALSPEELAQVTGGATATEYIILLDSTQRIKPVEPLRASGARELQAHRRLG